MGGDETLPMGACSRASIGSFYAKVLGHLASLGKTPAAWQEVLWGSFGSHDQAPLAEIPKGTVFQIALDTAGHFDKRPASCGNLTRTGARCINSLVEHFYLDIAGGAPHQWYDLDIGLSNPAAERGLVGGEVCLCTQPHDCRRDGGLHQSATASAMLWTGSHLWSPGYGTGMWGALANSQMFDAAKDLVFSDSAMRWTWPRTAAAAGAFVRTAPYALAQHFAPVTLARF
eukprot:COSAG04_NODE_9990_length_814_cov_1.548252_1_plen_229_part_00